MTKRKVIGGFGPSISGRPVDEIEVTACHQCPAIRDKPMGRRLYRQCLGLKYFSCTITRGAGRIINDWAYWQQRPAKCPLDASGQVVITTAPRDPSVKDGAFREYTEVHKEAYPEVYRRKQSKMTRQAPLPHPSTVDVGASLGVTLAHRSGASASTPTYRIVIPGSPFPQPRARHTGRNGKAWSYKTKNHKGAERVYQHAMLSQWPFPPIEGPIVVGFTFYMPIPKSTPKYKRIAMLEGEVPHEKKPDLSNLIKFVEDCGNGIIWRDDSQIWRYDNPQKLYSDEPRTVIRVEWEETNV